MNTEKQKYSGIISLTKGGDALGQRLIAQLNQGFPELLTRHFDSDAVHGAGGIKQLLTSEFNRAKHWMFIGAAGIMVRAMAPLLKDKFQDPAVLVLDEAGQFVISLLSGHAGGANALATTLAQFTGGVAVITTATDVLGLASLDLVLQKLKVRLQDYRSLILSANSALTRGESIGLWVDEDYSIQMGASIKDWQPQLPGLMLFQDKASLLAANLGLKIYVGVNPRLIEAFKQNGVQVVVPRAFILGTGVKKQLPTSQYIDVLSQWLEKQGICPEAIDTLVSIRLKAEETCLLEAASCFGWQTHFYKVADLMPYEALFEASSWVKETTGIASVSGPAVLKAIGGQRDCLIGQSYRGNGCTFTIGRKNHD